MKISSFLPPSQSFTANVLKLATGSTLAQALGFLIAPIITRLFAPEAFGVCALFISITAIVGVIACLRYEQAIMLPQTHEEAVNVLAVCICSTILIALFSGMIVVFAGSAISRRLAAPELNTYLGLIPLAVLFSGLFTALNYWNSRTKHFGRLSVAQIISSVTTQAAKLSAGFAGFVSSGVLIGATILGGGVSAGALTIQVWRDDRRLFAHHVRWRNIARMFLRFKKFPLIDSWGGLLNSISWQLPALMLSSFFSITVVGFYALVMSVIKSTSNILSGTIAQVFFQQACEERTSHGELVEKIMERLMFIGILPTIVLAISGEELFGVLFGQRWSEAGCYSQILAPWFFVWFLSSPLSTLFSVYERQGSALTLHSFIFVTRVVSLYIGGIYQNIYLALGLFSATGVLAYTFVAIWNIRLANADGIKILSHFIKYGLYSLPPSLLLLIIKYIAHCGHNVIASSAIIIFILYVFIVTGIYRQMMRT